MRYYESLTLPFLEVSFGKLRKEWEVGTGSRCRVQSWKAKFPDLRSWCSIFFHVRNSDAKLYPLLDRPRKRLTFSESTKSSSDNPSSDYQEQRKERLRSLSKKEQRSEFTCTNNRNSHRSQPNHNPQLMKTGFKADPDLAQFDFARIFKPEFLESQSKTPQRAERLLDIVKEFCASNKQPNRSRPSSPNKSILKRSNSPRNVERRAKSSSAFPNR